MSLLQRRPTVSWAALGVLQAVRKGDSSPLFSAGEATSGVLDFPISERHGHNQMNQRAMKMMKYLSCEGRLTEPGLFSLEKRGM